MSLIFEESFGAPEQKRSLSEEEQVFFHAVHVIK